MIKNKTPLTLAEMNALVGDGENADKMKKFVKTFGKLKIEDAKKLREELVELDILKLKEEHIVSLVNFVPEDAQDVNKILSEVSLDQEETNKVLDVIKKY